MEEDNICDNLQELRNMLQLQLHQTGVGNIIRDMVREISLAKGTGIESLDPHEILQEIYKRGLMANILEKLKRFTSFNQFIEEDVPKENPKEKEASEVRDAPNDEVPLVVENPCLGVPVGKISEIGAGVPAKSSNRKFYMKLDIFGGESFLDHTFDGNRHSTGDGEVKSTNSRFTLHILYKSQRFCLKPVACSSEPKFKATIMLAIGNFEGEISKQMLGSISPLRFILLRENECKTTLLSHSIFDGRCVLMSPTSSKKFAIELKGTGPEHNIPIGILDTCITICPSPNEELSKATLTSQTTMEKYKMDEKERLYLVFTRKWWKEFLEIHPDHPKRLVKLFSYDENTISRPVQSFVKTVRSDRLIRTPFEAAWFVSLIPVRTLGSESFHRLNVPICQLNSLSTCWQTIECTISSKSGTVEDHANLLCSLLLGFGLETYAAIGTRLDEVPWTWVVTLDDNYAPTFWESTTGQFYKHVQPEEGEIISARVGAPRRNACQKFLTVDCMFNDKSFFANIQPSNSIETMDWNILNPSKWKRIPESAVKCLIQSRNSFAFPLRPSSPNAIVLATDLELELKQLLTSTRKNVDMDTRFDLKLAQILGQELTSYELEMSTGAKNIPSELENVIMQNILPGYHFKACPLHFSCTTDTKQMYRECLRERKVEEIIYCRGADVHLAVRCDVFTYPEDITSVRIMFACKYLPTS